jgi:hypothetical protein
MADQFLTLLDLANRRGTDTAVGLVEEVVTVAPEFEKVMGRPIKGISYHARVRTAYSAKVAFRSANEGVEIGSSKYARKEFKCFFFDGQMQVDEADVKAANQENDSSGELLADEASGEMRAKAIAFGTQFYQGTLNDPKGCIGLADLMTSHTSIFSSDKKNLQVIDAAGSTAGACECVWYIWMHPQGVHLLFGNEQGIDMAPWQRQQVKDSNNRAFTAWVSNLSGYIGVSGAHNRAVGVIKNLDLTIDGNGAFTKPWTDAYDLALYGRFPVGIKPNLCFASRAAVTSLQRSRAVTIMANLGIKTADVKGSTSQYAQRPTETASGVPIIETDSILAGNAIASSIF